VLDSFQLVFAAARLGEGTLPLPAGLHPVVRRLVHTANEALAGVDDLAVRVRARAEASTQVPLAALTRSRLPELSPRQQAIDQDGASRLSESLLRLADAVHQRVPVESHDEALDTDHLARLLRELSTIVEEPGTTAPGTAAATRAAARSLSTLTDDERHSLDVALGALDDQSSWARARQTLDDLLVTLTRHR
jgi:hypothetical protein